MSEVEYGRLPGVGSEEPPKYRVLLFDKDGRVHSSNPIPAHDDASARAVTRRMANGLSAELWDGLRYIDRYDGS